MFPWLVNQIRKLPSSLKMKKKKKFSSQQNILLMLVDSMQMLLPNNLDLLIDMLFGHSKAVI
jgi:hypothetical protein